MKNQQPITLRALEPEDIDLLYQIENDPSLWKVGASNMPFSRFTLQRYIAETTGDFFTDQQLRLVMENSQKERVGLIDLFNFSPAHRRAEVGIVVTTPFRRRGYALSALEQIIDYATNILHIHQLYAYIALDNEASLNLFQQAAFRKTSLLKDWLHDGKGYSDVVVVQCILNCNDEK